MGITAWNMQRRKAEQQRRAAELELAEKKVNPEPKNAAQEAKKIKALRERAKRSSSEN